MIKVPPDLRNALVRQFRRQSFERIGRALFVHEAEWILATEGYVLTDIVVDGRHSCLKEYLAIPDPADPTKLKYEYRAVVARPTGICHQAAMLCAYKVGKSFSVADLVMGYACIPKSNCLLVGLEYKTSEHEFEYLEDLLLSKKQLGLRAAGRSFDVRNGKMFIELKNGAWFQCLSWNQKETMKGDAVDIYSYNECYQFPGLECFTSLAQNLRERRGHAVFSSTCDRPWLKILHQMGHGADPDWHCTCQVPGWVNPITFDVKALTRDCPLPEMLQPYVASYPWLASVVAAIQARNDRGVAGLMTKERFEIAWLGKLGTFAGSVYGFQVGERQFSPLTHPYLFRPSAIEKMLTDIEGVA